MVGGASVVDATALYRLSPEARAAAERAAAEQAAERREADIDAAVQPYADGDPPEADGLGIDVTSLPPARAMLARFAAWLNATRAELDQLETGRARLLETLGVPALTAARIKELVESDTTRFLNWMAAGGAGLTIEAARSFERAELDRKLIQGEHQAEIARTALDRAEFKIDVLRKAVAALESRHEGFARDALIEHAAPLIADYEAAAARLSDTLRPLLSLGAVVGARGRFRDPMAPNTIDLHLPGFAGVRPAIAIDEADLRKESALWRTRVSALMRDPGAELDLTS